MEQVEYQQEIEAEYALEKHVCCPSCRDTVQTVHAVRILRSKVNFTSNLPRRGCVLICPSCNTILSAILGARIGL